jgi:hypothetical protein
MPLTASIEAASGRLSKVRDQDTGCFNVRFGVDDGTVRKFVVGSWSFSNTGRRVLSSCPR